MRADLTGAYLARAVLTGADLTGADLTRAVLTEADLARADLIGAVLTGAMMPSPVQSATLQEAAENVADWLRGRWVQECWIETPSGAYAGDCRACLHGAVVYMGGPFGPELSRRLDQAGYTTKWNDAADRTEEQVCAALREIASTR